MATDAAANGAAAEARRGWRRWLLGWRLGLLSVVFYVLAVILISALDPWLPGGEYAASHIVKGVAVGAVLVWLGRVQKVRHTT